MSGSNCSLNPMLQCSRGRGESDRPLRKELYTQADKKKVTLLALAAEITERSQQLLNFPEHRKSRLSDGKLGAFFV